jgi:hypothetical protein
MSLTGWKFRTEQLLATLAKFCWVLFLVTLPVTSFPFFPGNIGGGTLVRPLSIYPLVILLVLIVIPRFFTKPLPKTVLSFMPFIVVAVASSFLASLRGIESLQEVSVIERALRSLAALAIGGSTYLLVTLWPKDEADLRFSLRWIYIGFIFALVWGSLQALYIIQFSQPWFDFLSSIQDNISIRRLFVNRISGLTYEPSWFADQITFLLLPWLLAAVLSRYSVFKWRWRWVTVELLLMIWALALLPFTFSRAGLLVMMVVVFIGVLFFRTKRTQPTTSSGAKKRLPFRRIAEGVLLVLILAGLIFVAGTRNEYFARIWEYWQRRPEEGSTQYLINYFEYLGFGARYSYWESAYQIYEENPAIGVGLGNYAFYFDENLPNRPLAEEPEVLRLVVPEEERSRLITPKNLFLRIMAETGLLGLATFFAFLTAVLGCALYLWYIPQNGGKYWGTGGLLGMIAFALLAFSLDSFAIPNMWVVFGLITAAMRIWRQNLQQFPVQSGGDII